MAKIIDLNAYKVLYNDLEYNNSRMIECINEYNNPVISQEFHHREYLYYKEKVIKLNKELADMLA
jgi:hypothetical protein